MDVTNSAKTAMTRTALSRPVKYLLNTMELESHPCGNKGMLKILDFGCGRGSDVTLLREMGFDIIGYDPHQHEIGDKPYLSNTLPRTKFDLILLTYVVNVVAEKERDIILQRAWKRVRKGGRLIITTRTPKELKEAAGKSGWTNFGRGYLTKIGTYQRGYTCGQLYDLVKKKLDKIMRITSIRPHSAGGSMVIVRKD